MGVEKWPGDDSLRMIDRSLEKKKFGICLRSEIFSSSVHKPAGTIIKLCVELK